MYISNFKKRPLMWKWKKKVYTSEGLEEGNGENDDVIVLGLKCDKNVEID